jgi:hypothetical protein
MLNQPKLSLHICLQRAEHSMEHALHVDASEGQASIMAAAAQLHHAVTLINLTLGTRRDVAIELLRALRVPLARVRSLAALLLRKSAELPDSPDKELLLSVLCQVLVAGDLN